MSDTERDELAEVIAGRDRYENNWVNYNAIADAVLAAGYRKTDEDREEFAVRVDDPEYWGYEIEPAETLQKARVSAWKRRGASVVRRTVSEWVPVDEKGGQS
jgi:hypothetical protein